MYVHEETRQTSKYRLYGVKCIALVVMYHSSHCAGVPLRGTALEPNVKYTTCKVFCFKPHNLNGYDEFPVNFFIKSQSSEQSSNFTINIKSGIHVSCHPIKYTMEPPLGNFGVKLCEGYFFHTNSKMYEHENNEWDLFQNNDLDWSIKWNANFISKK